MRSKLLCLTAVAGLYPATTSAQEAGGVHFNFGVAQRFETTSNRDLSDPSTSGGQDSTTTLSFGITSETRSETLAFNLSTDLQLSNDASPVFTPEIALTYERNSTNANLSLGASWAQTSVQSAQDAAVISGEIPDDFTDLTGTGTQTISNVNGTLAWGEIDPVGYSIGVAVTDVDYSDANADLTDSTRTRLTGGMRLDINAATTADVTLRYSRRDSTDAGFEDSLNLTSLLTFSRPQGDITAGLTAVRDDDDDIRLSANLGRTFALPNTTLSTTIGISDTDQSGALLIGRLAYQQEFPTAQINVTARRAVDDVNTTSNINASYAMEITPLSSLRFAYDFAHVHDRDTGDDVSLKGLSAIYQSNLTEDWRVNLGLSHDRRSDLVGQARSNTLFLVLERDFSYLR